MTSWNTLKTIRPSDSVKDECENALSGSPAAPLNPAAAADFAPCLFPNSDAKPFWKKLKKKLFLLDNAIINCYINCIYTVNSFRGQE